MRPVSCFTNDLQARSPHRIVIRRVGGKIQPCEKAVDGVVNAEDVARRMAGQPSTADFGP
jgi:hypothetical protein